MNTRVVLLIGLVAMVTLTGCPQAGVEPRSLPQDAASAGLADPSGVGGDDTDQRRAAAWLLADSDGDGLNNGIELEFGLDPEDPADGPDIDGDGILNVGDDDVDGDGVLNDTDVDVDGDGDTNAADGDIDGDGILNEFDLDADGDSIWQRWDFDGDADGEDDHREAGDDDETDNEGDGADDADDEDDPALNEAGEKMAAWVGDVFGAEITDSELEQNYSRMADWVDDLFGDTEPQYTADYNALRKFHATLIQLIRRAEGGDLSARDDLRSQLGGMETVRRFVKSDSDQAKLIVQTIGERFRSDEMGESDVRLMLNQLMLTRQIIDEDATDALDVLFRHGVELRDPWASDAAEEYRSRIDGVRRMADRFHRTDLPVCSDAVSRLTGLSGEGSLGEKVDGVIRLAGAIEDPELGAMMDSLQKLAQALDGRYTEWGWDPVFDSLENAPDIENGISDEIIDYVVDDVGEA